MSKKKREAQAEPTFLACPAEPEPSGEEGWCDIRVAEAILTAAQTRTAVALEPYQRRRRPTLAQVEHIRPVKKQEPVHAPSPSLK